MAGKYAQFIAHMQRERQPDTEKLIEIATFLRQKFQLIVQREAILRFDRETGKLIGEPSSWITEEQFRTSKIHVPDLLFFIGNKMYLMEIDGTIHNTNATVARKDIERNECYERAGITCRIFNEWECLMSLGIDPNRSATAKELIKIIEREIKLLVEEC